MATNTYVAIETQTLASNTATVTFSSIIGTYTDLVLVCTNTRTNTADVGLRIRFNGDSASNYANTFLYGTGSSFGSVRNSSTSINAYYAAIVGTATNAFSVTNIMNYSNSTNHKTVLTRDGAAASGVDAMVGTWRNTAAITQIDITCSNGTSLFATGSVFSLYGIASTPQITSAKATGGTITFAADGYTYHAFTAGGNFVPSSNITCDYLLVAGGGGGAGYGAGGGAGGYYTNIRPTGGAGTPGSAISLSSGTTYTIAVGAAGAGVGSGLPATSGGDGGPSSISGSGLTTITALGGGGGGGENQVGRSGGSGGGGGTGGQAVGAGTANQGFDGGSSPVGGGGGGGGAGRAGQQSRSLGTGGIGLVHEISTIVRAGQSVSGIYYLAGGGGSTNESGTGGAGGLGGGGAGGLVANPGTAGTAGTTNTGGGGGGGGFLNGSPYTARGGGAGGSGIVILRYPSV
jgi:hypothetical protein